MPSPRNVLSAALLTLFALGPLSSENTNGEGTSDASNSTTCGNIDQDDDCCECNPTDNSLINNHTYAYYHYGYDYKIEMSGSDCAPCGSGAT